MDNLFSSIADSVRKNEQRGGNYSSYPSPSYVQPNNYQPTGNPSFYQTTTPYTTSFQPQMTASPPQGFIGSTNNNNGYQQPQVSMNYSNPPMTSTTTTNVTAPVTPKSGIRKGVGIIGSTATSTSSGTGSVRTTGFTGSYNTNSVSGAQIFGLIAQDLGPKTRENYAANGKAWVDMILYGLNPNEVKERMHLLIRQCNRLPLNLEAAKARLAYNQGQSKNFLDKAQLDNSQPYENLNTDGPAFLSLLQSYPPQRVGVFEWDGVASHPLFIDIAVQMKSSLLLLDTKWFQFAYHKGVFKANKFTDMFVIVANHIEIIGHFVSQAGKGTFQYMYWLPDGNFIPTELLQAQANHEGILKLISEVTGSPLSQTVKDFNELTEKGEREAYTLVFGKFLLPVNPNLLRMTSSYRMLKKRAEGEAMKDIITEFMNRVILLGLFITQKAIKHDEALKLIAGIRDPIAKKSLERSYNLTFQTDFNKKLKEGIVQANDNGINWDNDDVYMQTFFTAHNVVKMFCRSYKRHCYGLGSIPDTRLGEKTMNRKVKLEDKDYRTEVKVVDLQSRLEDVYKAEGTMINI